jgi:pilus assembly protein CpaF
MTVLEPALIDQLRFRLAESGSSATPSAVAAALRAEGRLVGDTSVLDAVDALRRESLGAGVLEPLLGLDGVTDVLVNGPDEVYVDTGCGLERTSLHFADDDAVRRLAQRLAASAGRRLDDGCPYVDVRLVDGTRLHAVLAPLARPGTCLSLRVPARRALSMQDLVNAGTLRSETAGILCEVVEARLAFVVTGGTGSGKTTLLNTMLSLVPADERIVVVEDAGELRPRHPHVVSLEARQANVEGAGAIGLSTLVRQALRMRPDRLVVGEVRGAEVVDLMAALNTGHEGGCSTVHANSGADLPARFEALGVAAGLSRDAVHAQLVSALDLVLHLRRDRDGTRRLAEIGVVTRAGSGHVEVSPAVTFSAHRDPVLGPSAPRFDALLGRAAGP